MNLKKFRRTLKIMLYEDFQQMVVEIKISDIHSFTAKE